MTTLMFSRAEDSHQVAALCAVRVFRPNLGLYLEEDELANGLRHGVGAWILDIVRYCSGTTSASEYMRSLATRVCITMTLNLVLRYESPTV